MAQTSTFHGKDLNENIQHLLRQLNTILTAININTNKPNGHQLQQQHNNASFDSDPEPLSKYAVNDPLNDLGTITVTFTEQEGVSLGLTIVFSPLVVGHETDVKKQKSSIMIEEKENENVNENEIIYDDIKIDHEDIKSEKKKKKNKDKLPILPGGAPLMRQFDYNRNFERIRGRHGYTETFLTMILSETLSTGLQRYISKNQRETYLHPWTVYTNGAENVVFDVGLCWTERA
eukprot:UN11017